MFSNEKQRNIQNEHNSFRVNNGVINLMVNYYIMDVENRLTLTFSFRK